MLASLTYQFSVDAKSVDPQTFIPTETTRYFQVVAKYGDVIACKARVYVFGSSPKISRIGFLRTTYLAANKISPEDLKETPLPKVLEAMANALPSYYILVIFSHNLSAFEC